MKDDNIDSDIFFIIHMLMHNQKKCFLYLALVLKKNVNKIMQ